MKTVINFIIGAAGTLGSYEVVTQGVSDIPPEIVEMIKAIISMIGGCVTAILMHLLKKKFPDIFGKKNKK